MIKGLLRKNPIRRWSPWKCLKWLWKHENLKRGTDMTISRKRPASGDLQPLQGADDDRYRRSPNPTLSPTRVQVFVFQEDKSLPDTASPSSRLPDVPSTASTPRIHDTTLDLNQQEDDESSGADTELGNSHDFSPNFIGNNTTRPDTSALTGIWNYAMTSPIGNAGFLSANDTRGFCTRRRADWGIAGSSPIFQPCLATMQTPRDIRFAQSTWLIKWHGAY